MRCFVQGFGGRGFANWGSGKGRQAGEPGQGLRQWQPGLGGQRRAGQFRSVPRACAANLTGTRSRGRRAGVRWTEAGTRGAGTHQEQRATGAGLGLRIRQKGHGVAQQLLVFRPRRGGCQLRAPVLENGLRRRAGTDELQESLDFQAEGQSGGGVEGGQSVVLVDLGAGWGDGCGVEVLGVGQGLGAVNGGWEVVRR
jgi:hypothetical protein